MTVTPDLDRPTANQPAVPARRPRLSVAEAVRRHRLLVLVPVLLFVAAAAAFGLNRKPVYTAESRLAVARVDVSAPGALAGFAVAAQSLAETYARAVSAEGVVDAVAREVDLRPETVAGQISAAPVPQTPVFRVIAKAQTEDRAVLLANTTGVELIKYVETLNREDPDSERLYSAYRRASLRSNAAQAERDELQSDYDEDPSSRLLDRLVEARADYEAARLRSEALQQAYLASQQGQSSTSLLQRLTRAQSADSDRGTRLQILLFVALLAGLAVGVALALMRADRTLRRSFG